MAIVELLTNSDVWLAFITLTALEIVLGVDNLVMIAILVSALPKERQTVARRLGIGFALLTRVALLFTISWLARLVSPLFFIASHPFSVRDLVLFFGGAFLLYKGIVEIFALMQPEKTKEVKPSGAHIYSVVLQIALFDIIFSLDSVITAVGMSNDLPVMVSAIVIAMAVMLFASGPIIVVIERYVSVKVLALAFLLIVGVMLVTSSFGVSIPKGYIYTAMGFSALVEVLVIIISGRQKAGHIHV